MAVWHISMNEQFVTNIWIATKWTVRIYISVIAELEYVKGNSFSCLRGVLFGRYFHIKGLYTCTYWWAKDLGLGIHACSNTVYTHHQSYRHNFRFVFFLRRIRDRFNHWFLIDWLEGHILENLMNWSTTFNLKVVAKIKSKRTKIT